MGWPSAMRSPKQKAEGPSASTGGSSRQAMPERANATAAHVRPGTFPFIAVARATTTACNEQIKAAVPDLVPISRATACAAYPKAHSPPTVAPSRTEAMLVDCSANGASTRALRPNRAATKRAAPPGTSWRSSIACLMTAKFDPHVAVITRSSNCHGSCEVGSTGVTAADIDTSLLHDVAKLCSSRSRTHAGCGCVETSSPASSETTCADSGVTKAAGVTGCVGVEEVRLIIRMGVR
mmetsp:Transcript_19433/g.41874  ORF Transcript_19433/g.41874 Transcript_19433/m.41874 type:complete len:237 (-) Transcript_19433:126-836(-)